MWKLILGFLVFAGGAMYLLSQGGDIDMGGEKHGVETHEPASGAASAASH
ncbi:MAG: hypothetical protein RLZZ592_1621 [Pseudomonadota bacterium]|jgi:hypothetical protein